MVYYVKKYIDGFSACFRQWNASHSHCKFLHGYAIAFRLHCKSYTLDKNNWVLDFSWLKNNEILIDEKNIYEWLHYMFDHTVILSDDDPEIELFRIMEKKNIIQLRIIPNLSCEGIGKFILNNIAKLIEKYSNGRVKLYRLDVIENNKNTACVEIM